MHRSLSAKHFILVSFRDSSCLSLTFRRVEIDTLSLTSVMHFTQETASDTTSGIKLQNQLAAQAKANEAELIKQQLQIARPAAKSNADATFKMQDFGGQMQARQQV